MKKWRPRATDTSCICLRNDFRCIHIKRKSRTAIFKDSRLFWEDSEWGAVQRHLSNPLAYVNSFDVTALIEAIYDMVNQNQAVCRVLILENTNSTVLMRMIALAKEDSIAYWRKNCPMPVKQILR